MKQDVAKKWVKALRSGKYKKAKGALKTDKGYCCLGVLCEVLGMESSTKPDSDGHYTFGLNDTSALPPGARKASGVANRLGTLSTDPDAYSLAAMNDGSDGSPTRSFNYIANFIEKNWEAL